METNAPRSAGFYDFLGWVEANKQRVVIYAGVLCLIALAAGIWVWRGGQSEIEAEEALSAIRVDGPLPAGTGDLLAKIAAEYSGTSAAGKALLRSGTAYFAEGQFAKARQQFEAYLRDFGDTPWVAEAVLGVATSLEAEGKTAEAINKYKDFLNSYGTAPSADIARFNLARLYEQSNQLQLALETLQKMAVPSAPNTQPSPSAQEAQMRIRALLTKHPSLMPAPAAPTAQPRPPAQPPLVLKPQDPPGGATPQVIVNPAQPTPGQPNPPGTQPQIIVNPAQPAPAPAAPTQPAPTPPATTPAK